MAGVAGATALMLLGVLGLGAADYLAHPAVRSNVRSFKGSDPPVDRWYETAFSGTVLASAGFLAVGLRWALSLTVRSGLTQALVALGAGVAAIAVDALVSRLRSRGSPSLASPVESARRRILVVGGGAVALFGLFHLIALALGQRS